ARHAGLLPAFVGSRRPCAGRPGSAAHLVAPVLAGAILAALDEILRSAGESVVGLAERRHPAVAVVVEPDIEPHLRHPLGMAHGARPGAAHLLGRAPAPLDDDERVEQFLLPIGAAARLSPRERRERRDDGAHVVLLHVRIAEGRFDAPEPEHDPAVDPVVLFDAGKERGVFLAFSLPVVMRQSETRRLRYCQSCSLNSGWERMSSKTVVSGLILPITRVYVASDMPRACARARKAATHWSNDDLLACARAVALHVAMAA